MDPPLPLPPPPPPPERRADTSVVLVAVLGGGFCLALAILGLVVLGYSDEGDAQIASTGLAAVASTLAGGFGGWIARGAVERRREVA